MKRIIAALLFLSPAVAASAEDAWIRINQLGYLPGSMKVAVLVSKTRQEEITRFELVDALTGEVRHSSTAVKSFGAWGAFASASRLDFSGFSREGAYQVRAGGITSPPFRIARGVYDGSAEFLLRYLRQQRSGYNPFLNDSCHTRDGYIIYHPTLDSTHIDVAGGWHDASDYLQYVATSATAVAHLLFAYEQHPGVFRDSVGADGRPGRNGIPDILDEAKWGLDWLMKMNPAPRTMFNQLADDRDHLGFRLPTQDPVDYGKGKERPVYFCTGKPQGIFGSKNRSTGIASTAGKFSTAFAMAARVMRPSHPELVPEYARKSVDAFQFGRENPGVCQTAPCRSPYFYEEDNWVDDMELAATQLELLYPDSAFGGEAADYGIQEPVTPWMGEERVRHYQWYPFLNLGHYFIARGKGEDRNVFAEFLRRGLSRVQVHGAGNPFLNGVPFIWCSNNLVSAAVTQARLYRLLTGDTQFAEMEAGLRDWLFGCNPWGTSMIVGLPGHGVSPRDPHSAFTHVYGYRIDGGLVDGPVYASIFSNLKGVTLSKPDPFAAMQSDVAVYHDDWADYSTNEPTMDGTASLAYLLASLESEGKSGGNRAHLVVDRGGIIRMDSTRKEIYLVFTGHEFGEGVGAIRAALRKNRAKGSFFFTGDFYRNPAFATQIKALKSDGHYLGAHSDRHLLYAPWSHRDSLLVTREEFSGDLRANYAVMADFQIKSKDAQVFLPPFEWYNGTISGWAADLGLSIVNFTPGTYSNADYTYPGGEGRYVTSDSIIARVLEFERSSPRGLNGAILLIHAGVDPRRPDPLYDRLDALLKNFRTKGYVFRRF